MKKFKRTISILLATALMAFTASVMTGCLGPNRPRGEYWLYDVTVLDRRENVVDYWHWEDDDFYFEWGDSFLYFSWDWMIYIDFDDWDGYHAELNGWWDFSTWNMGGGLWAVELEIYWWSDAFAWD